MTINSLLRRLLYLPPGMFPAGAAAPGKFIHIRHDHAFAGVEFPREQLEQVARQKWYFAHASVGADLLNGIADLHRADPRAYPLQNIPAAATPPAVTQPGVIYDHSRGNPGWRAKFNGFASCVSNGWRFPAVNVVLDKLCYIDQAASLNYYVNSMSRLESAYPETVFVYSTLPLMTSADGDNWLRHRYNTRLREWCRLGGRVLFDIADLEAHDAAGAPCEFTYRGQSCQRLCDAYTGDGGHLNPQARQSLAKGLYALGAALANRTATAGGK